jgi:hypothetical protein
MSHTPGPWKIQRHTLADKEFSVGPATIAYDDVDHDEQDANAALIAAAPELLEACEAAIRYDAALQKRVVNGVINIMDTGGAVAMGDDLDALYNDWIDKCGVAIRKARGL